MQTLANVIASELRADETIKKLLSERRPFQVSLTELQKYIQGEIVAGSIFGNTSQLPLRLRRGIDTRLMLFSGRPGSGKTNLLRSLAAQCMYHGDKIAVISRKGYEFSSLLLSPGIAFYDMTPEDIRMGPFYPPTRKVSKEEWNVRIANSLGAESWMLYASQANFHKVISQFSDQHPRMLITPSKLIAFIVEKKAYKLLDIDEKVRNRMEGLITGCGKKLFDSNEVFEFEFYAHNSFNFRLDALSSNQVLYFIAIFIEMLTCYKQHEHDMTRYHVILDDFSDLLQEDESRAKMSELVKMVMVHGRKLNIDLWVVAQSSFPLSKYILDNISTVFQFSTGDLSSAIMNQVNGLSERESELISRCPAGVCAVSKKMMHM